MKKRLIIAAALILTGCASHAPAPSTAPVASRINDASHSVSDAQTHSAKAQGKIQDASKEVRAIDAKVVRLLR